MEFIHTLEDKFGKKAQIQMLPMQPGDVHTTYADTAALSSRFGYKPATTLDDGIAEFVKWYKTYICCYATPADRFFKK